MTAGKPASFNMVEFMKPTPLKKSRKERGKRKSSGTLCKSGVMDEDIWRNLPEDLFDVVVARLPIAIFFRFRTVCKRWNSLLTSQSFSLHCAEAPRKYPWYYTISRENADCGMLYDPSLKKWHRTNTPMLLSKSVFTPVALGGLVCFHDRFHRKIYVCNPLTRSYRKLPPWSGSLLTQAGLGMAPSQNATSVTAGYKVMWLGRYGEYRVFDSVKNSWTGPLNTPSSIKVPLICLGLNPVSINSTIIFLRSDPVGIVSYDTTTGIWKEFIVPVPLNSSAHSLAECDGRLLLVGLLTENAAICVCIWELQKMTLLWKEIDRMPNLWCMKRYEKPIGLHCLCNTGLLLLSLPSRRKDRLVTYNAASKEWRKVRGHVLPGGRKHQFLGCGIAFHPNPTAMA